MNITKVMMAGQFLSMTHFSSTQQQKRKRQVHKCSILITPFSFERNVILVYHIVTAERLTATESDL